MRVVFYGDPSASQLADAIKLCRAAGLTAVVRTAKYFNPREAIEKADLFLIQDGRPKSTELVEGHLKAGACTATISSEWTIKDARYEGAEPMLWPETHEHALEMFSILTAPVPEAEVQAETTIKLEDILKDPTATLLSDGAAAAAAAGLKGKGK